MDIPDDYTNYLANLRSILVQTELSWLNEMKKLEENNVLDVLNCPKSVSPLIEASSESELESESLDESRVPSPPHDQHILDSVGPPRILRFRSEDLSYDTRELNNIDINTTFEGNYHATSHTFTNKTHLFFENFDLIKNGNRTCKFCAHITQTWPTLDQQKSQKPEDLYCCSDYRDFAEAIFEYEQIKDRPKRDHTQRSSTKSQITPNVNVNSIGKKVIKKNEAQEKVAERYFEKQKERAFKTQMQLTLSRQESLMKKLNDKDKQSIKVNQHAPIVHDKQSLELIEESDVSDLSISKQIRSINYQLSNLRHFQEGWTVRPVSPMGLVNFDEYKSDDELLVNASISSLKQRERPLLVKFYKNGQISLIIFPDGTGNVFYANGSLAISISLVTRGLYVFSVFHKNGQLLAHFDPYGNANCNYTNGQIHLQTNSIGGLELDLDGARKRQWFWSSSLSSSSNSHAPHYQPIIFALNGQIGVKIHTLSRMFLSFVSDGQIFRFNVGSNLQHLKGSHTRRAPIDEYLKKTRARINFLLKNINSNANKLSSIRLPKLLLDRSQTQIDSNQKDHHKLRDNLNNSSIVFSLTQVKVPGLTNAYKKFAFDNTIA